MVFLSKDYVKRYLPFFYELQLDAEAAAAVLILFRSNRLTKDVYTKKQPIIDPFS